MRNKRVLEDVAHVCPVCGRSFEGRRSFGTHLGRSHPNYGGAKKYVLERQLNNNEPTCNCGCGQLVSWSKTKHRYADYVSGHNDTGYNISDYVQTQEQRTKNTEAVRRAYESNREQIIAKISNSVKKALSESTFDFSEHAKRLWTDDTHVRRVKESQRKAWQGVNGELRRSKVFTKEFGRKISESNLSRDVNKTSHEEQAFVERLKAIVGEHNVQTRWLNLDERTLRPDVYLVDKDVYVEFDGIYWHGLDRNSDWNVSQLLSIANDLDKNLLARDGKFNLIRVRSDVDIQKIETYQDLVDTAYHVVMNGHVIKEGTFRLVHDDQVLLSRDKLIALNQQDRSSNNNYVEAEVVPIVFRLLRSHVAYWGWFYPVISETAAEIISQLSAREIVNNFKFDTNSNVGTSYLKSTLKSFWNVDGGPLASFYNDKSLRSVLRYRMGLNNSKSYDYTMRDGSRVACNETFDISLRNVRRGFVVKRKAVSFFRPALACDIYSAFLDGVEHPKVWDPSAGFGARMLGFAAALRGRSGKYWANEPASQTYTDGIKLADVIGKELLEVVLSKDGSEVAQLPEQYFDLVFTSPPYFDCEKYYDEVGQCWKDFPSFDAWIEGYLRKTYVNAYRCLKSGSRMLINFNERCSKHSIEVAKSVGFIHERSVDLSVNKDHFLRSRSVDSSPRVEKLDVFLKP